MTWIVRSVLILVVASQSCFVIRDVRYDRALDRGIDAYETARVDDVRASFEAARALDDDDPYLWAWTGDAALYEYDYRSDGAVIDSELGRALLDEAWAAYAASVARAPVYSWSWIGLSEVAGRRARLDELQRGVDLGRLAKVQQGVWDPGRATALTAAHVALDLNPRGFMQLDALADVYAAAGDSERAAEYLVRSATAMPDPSLHSWGVGPRMERRLYAQLIDALRRGVTRAPPFDHSDLRREIARFAREQRDFDTALEELDLALEAAGDNPHKLHRSYREQAQVLQELGEYDRAIEALERLMSTGQGVDAARRQLAHLLRLTGRFEEACIEYRRPQPSGAADDAWRIAGSLACERAGEYKAAERLLREGLYDPTEHRARARALLELYVRNGKGALASSRLEGWIDDSPEDSELVRWGEELGLVRP